MSTDLHTDVSQVLDRSALDAIRALDEDDGESLLREILAAYFASCPGLLAQLDEGLSGNNADKARIATHTLKSSSANLGAVALSELCRQAENAARDGDLETVRKLSPHIQQSYKATCEALTRSLAA